MLLSLVQLIKVEYIFPSWEVGRNLTEQASSLWLARTLPEALSLAVAALSPQLHSGDGGSSVEQRAGFWTTLE